MKSTSDESPNLLTDPHRSENNTKTEWLTNWPREGFTPLCCVSWRKNSAKLLPFKLCYVDVARAVVCLFHDHESIVEWRRVCRSLWRNKLNGAAARNIVLFKDALLLLRDEHRHRSDMLTRKLGISNDLLVSEPQLITKNSFLIKL